MGKLIRKIQRAIGYLDTVKSSPEDVKLLEDIRKNVQLDADATYRQRELELDDLRFCDPTTQWSEQDRRDREGKGRPCLTEDHVGPFLLQVCNEQRKNKPAVQVNPVDSGSDPETAEVLQGLIRHIEYSSNADTAHDTAFWWAAAVGRGFYRLCTDYVDAESFNQEILIKRVPNPHMVFIDPTAQEADYSDAKWGGFKSWVMRDEFKATWPKSDLATAGASAWRSIGDDAEDWMSKDGGACMVVEYYYKKVVSAKLYMMADGTTTFDPGEETPVNERDSEKIKVCWVKCTAVEILESGELPGTLIPIVPVLGKETIVEGHRTYAGLVRGLKDPQSRFNYLLTSQTERIAFMPLATWLGPKGFMGKNKQVWATAHKNQMASLEFEIIGDDGQGINAPRLITEEAPIMAVTAALQGAEAGMKATTGMYNPSLGNREGSQSGVAIGRLQAQGETGNYHLQDNLSRAIRLEGRIAVSWIPTYYDTDSIIRIIGEDGKQQQVRINAPIEDQSQGLKKTQMGKVFDLKTGKYDVTIAVGPSYQSKVQETRDLLQAMLQGPMGQLIANRAGDLVAKTLESPISDELAKRLCPTEFKEADETEEGAEQLPPQMMMQIKQMEEQAGAAIEQLTAKVQELQGQVDSEDRKMQADMAKAELDSKTKIAIAQMNNETELIKIQATLDAQLAGDQLVEQLNDLQQVVLALVPEQEEVGPQSANAGYNPNMSADAGVEEV